MPVVTVVTVAAVVAVAVFVPGDAVSNAGGHPQCLFRIVFLYWHNICSVANTVAVAATTASFLVVVIVTVAVAPTVVAVVAAVAPTVVAVVAAVAPTVVAVVAAVAVVVAAMIMLYSTVMTISCSPDARDNLGRCHCQESTTNLNAREIHNFRLTYLIIIYLTTPYFVLHLAVLVLKTAQYMYKQYCQMPQFITTLKKNIQSIDRACNKCQ